MSWDLILGIGVYLIGVPVAAWLLGRTGTSGDDAVAPALGWPLFIILGPVLILMWLANTWAERGRRKR